MSLPIVTRENYYDTEINMAYMSASQYKSFEKCEAAALAELLGEYTPPATTALLVGSYVDAHFSGTLDIFRAQHPEIFKKDGGLKAEYVQAERIIERLEADELYSLLMSGEKQVVRTDTIAGVPFKIRIDSLLDEYVVDTIRGSFPDTVEVLENAQGAIVDQKIMRDMEDSWSEEDHMRLPFWQRWGYDTQSAVYQAVEGRSLPFILAVGTKQDTPDLAALYIPDDTLRSKLYEIEDSAPRYQAIKQGHIKPTRCERCAWCRATRRLTSIVDCEVWAG